MKADAVDRKKNLENLIAEYKSKHSCSLDAELAYYRKPKSLNIVLHSAARAEFSEGKRHPHQYRLPAGENLYHLVYPKLREQASSFETANSFDEVHEITKRAILDLPRIGPLMVYDTALRIGANLGFEPKKVYLHAGAKQGAKIFFKVFLKEELPINIQSIEKERFLGLDELSPDDVENFLCIMKGSFSGANGGHSRCRPKLRQRTSRC